MSSEGEPTREVVGESEDRALERIVRKEVADLTLTNNQRRAAILIAEGQKSAKEIAAECQCSVRELVFTWFRLPGFTELIKKHALVVEALAFQTGLGRRLYRIKQLNDRHDRLMRVIKAREAEAIANGESEVAQTGVVLKRGDEYRVDRDLLAELREIEKAAREEMDQFARIAANPADQVTRIRFRPINPLPPAGQSTDVTALSDPT